MAELLPGVVAIVLAKADVLDAGIAFEIEDALGGQAKKVGDLIVAGAPEMPIMAGVFDQDFMRTHGVHAVINAVAAAVRFALDTVEGFGMHHGTRGPGDARGVGRFRNHLRRWRGTVAEKAVGGMTWTAFGRIIAGNDPRAGDGILAEFHRQRRTL